MKKAISIHIIGTFIWLSCFLYIADGLEVGWIGRTLNVFALIFTNIIIAAYCDINDLYKNK